MTETFPIDLRIDSGGDDFFISGPAPRLSWQPTAGDAASLQAAQSQAVESLAVEFELE